MICIVSQHFRLNRILLLAIGLWPYQQSLLVRIQQFLFLSILGSFNIFQLTIFLTSNCTFNYVLKILSTSLTFTIFIIKYNSFWINSQTVKNLLEQLQNICNGFKDENEIIIMRKYGNNAKYYTIKMIVVSICSIFTVSFVSMWSHILDIILPLNESRYSKIQTLTEYFIDQEKYFYLTLLHMNATLCIGATTIIGTGTMLITYLKHACGIFKIASGCSLQSYRVSISGLPDNTIFSIVYITIFSYSSRFSKSVISTFEGSFFILIGFGVISLSLNLFEMYQVLLLGSGKEDFLWHFVLVIVILLYMFLANYAGQEIIDHNNHIYYTAYNVRWYVAPLHIQKLILFLLQRGSKVVNLNVGGLFIASLNCFASLASASISYFTFIYSTQ